MELSGFRHISAISKRLRVKLSHLTADGNLRMLYIAFAVSCSGFMTMESSSCFFIKPMFSLLYSLPAGLLSLTIQILLFRFVFPRLSLMSISFIGAVVHNLTQLFVASLIVNQNLMIALPVYLITGIAAGLFVGLAAYYIIRYLPKKVYLN